MKTIFEWLSGIVDSDVREKALNNMVLHGGDVHQGTPRDSLSHAITSAFVWSKTPEGLGYWMEKWREYSYYIDPSQLAMQKS